MDYTVHAAGNGSLRGLEMVALVDDNTPPAMGMVKVRIVHAAHFASTPEATEAVGTIQFDVVSCDLMETTSLCPWFPGNDIASDCIWWLVRRLFSR